MKLHSNPHLSRPRVEDSSTAGIFFSPDGATTLAYAPKSWNGASESKNALNEENAKALRNSELGIRLS